MKQTLLVILILSSIFAVAQPAQFEAITCGTTSSTQLNRYLLIDGFQPTTDDWAAVFDSDGFTVARGQVFSYVYDNCPNALGISMEVYGDDQLGICSPNFGLNPGETFNLVVWDFDTGIFYEVAETLTFTGSFAPFPGPGGDNCSNVNADQGSPFPVTFANLSARDLGGKVAINWSTASESGNDYFEVQHSTRLGGFSAVGEVRGAGDSQELLDYDFVHDNPASGTNYYRVKQVDFEGTYSYSGIIPVEVATAQSEAVTLFPNPAATGYFNLNVGSDWEVSNVSVSVLNAVGRRVMEWNQDVTATRQVMTTDLAAGIYLVRVEGGKRTDTKRLVVR